MRMSENLIELSTGIAVGALLMIACALWVIVAQLHLIAERMRLLGAMCNDWLAQLCFVIMAGQGPEARKIAEAAADDLLRSRAASSPP